MRPGLRFASPLGLHLSYFFIYKLRFCPALQLQQNMRPKLRQRNGWDGGKHGYRQRRGWNCSAKKHRQTTCHLTKFHTYRNTWTARRTRKTLKGIMMKVNWIKIIYLMIYLDAFCEGTIKEILTSLPSLPFSPADPLGPSGPAGPGGPWSNFSGWDWRQLISTWQNPPTKPENAS